MTAPEPQHKPQWRDYETAAGAKPVREFVQSLSSENAARVASAMKEVRDVGLTAARHLRGDIWEVRVDGEREAFRILFTTEGHFSHILLALEGFSKKTQKTPPRAIDLAERRLRDWRARGEQQRGGGKQAGRARR